MKKLNDLKCHRCRPVEIVDVFGDREIVGGSGAAAVTAICNQCGAEFRKIIPHFDMGVKAPKSEGSDGHRRKRR